MESMAKKKVLFLGIEPKFIDVNLVTATEWDANRVKAIAQEANNKLTELGYEVQNCLVDLSLSSDEWTERKKADIQSNPPLVICVLKIQSETAVTDNR